MTSMIAPEPPAYLAGLNEEQRQAVAQPRNMAVKVMAGAGTGKTELISRRFVKLVDELEADQIPRPQERILVVTFTIDAAVSMKTRIHQRLLKMGYTGLQPDVWISNFHAFANRVLHQYGLGVGLSPDFEVLTEPGQKALFERIIQNIKADEYGDLSTLLRDFRLGAIASDVLSVDNLADQFRILDDIEAVIDETALFDIIAQIKTAGLSPKEFYDLAVRQSQQLTDRILETTAPAREPETDAVDYVRACVAHWRGHFKDWVSPHWQPLQQAYSSKKPGKDGELKEPTASDYKNQVKFLSDLFLTGGRQPEPVYSPDLSFVKQADTVERNLIDVVAAVYALYQQALRQHNACDFDDLMNHTIRLFEENKPLRQKFQQQFEAIIVDEFQDSNGSQLRLLKLLMREESPNITVVGDVKQSIYAFRHAQPENMDLILEQKGKKLPHQDIHLQTNYRSYPAILNVANALTGELTPDEKQQLNSCDRYQEKSHPVTWLSLGEEGSGETVADLYARQKKWIAVEIANLLTKENYQPKDIAILVKGHNRASEIHQYLDAVGIPAVKKKTKGFFAEPVIKDAIALLRIIRNFSDNHAMVRILQSRLNQRQLRYLMSHVTPPDVSSQDGEMVPPVRLIDVLLTLSEKPDVENRFKPEAQKALTILAEELLSIKKRHRHMTPVQLFYTLVESVGIIPPETPPHKTFQQHNLLKTFDNLLYQIMRQSPLPPTLAEVVEILLQHQSDPGLTLPVGDLDTTQNAVQIMTIHSAKGLEFKAVFVAYVEGKSFGSRDKGLYAFDPQFGTRPGYGLFLKKYRDQNTLKKELYYQTWQKPRSESEQKRLFYVALTRAEEKLYVLCGKDSPAWAKPGVMYPSDAIQHFSEQDDLQAQHLQTHYWAHSTQTIYDWVQPLFPVTDQRPAPQKDHSADSETELASKKTTPLGQQELVVSFSAINSFNQCPVQYWLKYYCRLPEPPGEGAGQLSMLTGSFLHGLIHRYYLHQGQLKEGLIDQLLQSWTADMAHKKLLCADDRAALMDDVQQRFSQFLASSYTFNALQTCGLTVMPEKRLRFPWAMQNHPNVSVEVDGVLDLLMLDQAKQTYWLVDFKTNKTLDAAKKNQYFDQLLLYREGLSVLNPEIQLPDENVSLVQITAQGVDTIPLSKTNCDDLVATIPNIADVVAQQKMPQRPNHVQCHQIKCPYVSICPQAVGSPG